MPIFFSCRFIFAENVLFKILRVLFDEPEQVQSNNFSKRPETLPQFRPIYIPYLLWIHRSVGTDELGIPSLPSYQFYRLEKLELFSGTWNFSSVSGKGPIRSLQRAH